MKRSFLFLIIGVLCGVMAHLGWFYMRRPAAAGDLDAQLAWMQADLKLTDEQLGKIRVLHQASSARLVTLAAQVAGMRDEWTAFERERTTTGHVDFVEFARFVDQRRVLNLECVASTQRLVAASAGVMTPEQRARYLDLLAPALKDEHATRLQ